MGKKTIELTTEREAVSTVHGREPAVIRVRRQTKYGWVRYYMNNWLPVPAWMRHLDGWSVGSVLAALALALLILIGAGWALVRLLGAER